jgi:serine/threonine-protein kinase
VQRWVLVLICLAVGVLAPGRAHADDAQEDLTERLDAILGSLPGVDALIGKDVALAELPSEPGWLGLRKVRFGALRAAFQSALNRRGIHYPAEPPHQLRDPIGAAGLLRSGKLAAAFVVQCDADGGEGDLTVYLVPASNAVMGAAIKDTVPSSYGLVAWDRGRLALVGGGALALLVAWIGWTILRARAEHARVMATVPPPRSRAPSSPAIVADDGQRAARRSIHADGIALSDDAVKLLSDLGPSPLELAPEPSRPAASRPVPALAPAGTAATIAVRDGVDLPSGVGATALHESTPGLILGRYRVRAELGRGAMGVVLRAHDEHLEREVAIKSLSTTIRAFPDALRLFASEAKALAQLNHPNIVAIYDQASDEHEAYLIMELVEGQTLETLLARKGPLPIAVALGLVDQLCAGLAYAHGKNILHRDIKPANVFVTRDGGVKLGDFGLARVMHEVSIRQTEIRGTPLYMSPEQVTGRDVDLRADLYAVGCTLFELVTGRPPFTEGQVMYLHLTADPPTPSSLRADLPPGVDELILALLAKAADDRPPTAADVRRRIAALLPTLT